MKFAVVALGSAGDLHPFLAIARALVERGHEVHFLSQAPHASAVQNEGVRFVAVAGQEEHDRTLAHPLLWHPLHGFGVLWRHLAVPAVGPTIEALDRLSRSEPLTVFASPLAAGARLARERWPERIRLLSGYTAPMGLRSTSDPMFLGSWQVPAWLPSTARQLLWRALDRWKLEPMAQPAMRRWAERLAIPPLSGSMFGEALHSPDGGIALYPNWFAPVPRQWAIRGVRQTGFPVFEPADPAPAPEPVIKFIQDPRPYAVVYPGSAGGRAPTFAGHAVAACRALGMRALLLSRSYGDGWDTNSGVLRLDAASLRQVLPAAAVFLHHGGIGSAAQGLAAQVNQLVLASAYDQFENGARLERLQQAQWLPLDRASSASIRARLEVLTRNGTRAPALSDPPRHSMPGRPNSAVRETCLVLETAGQS